MLIKQQGKKWYETLWDYANGKYLYELWKHYKKHQIEKAEMMKGETDEGENDAITTESKKVS